MCSRVPPGVAPAAGAVAGGRHQRPTVRTWRCAHADLALAVDAQLRRLQPALSRCAWSQVVAEKRATYACTPRRVQAGGPRFAPGIYLAGDYVDTEYPATLEAAVRSGVAAAAALRADRR